MLQKYLKILAVVALFSSVFSSLFAQDTTPPAAPSSFSSAVAGSTVNLSWVNPVDGDFDSVTIRRSSSSYPTSVIEGSAVAAALTTTTYADTSVADGTYYYSIFARDATGNFSSAANLTLIVDTVTQTPTLTAPASSTAYRNLLIQYSLPEAPLSGSVSLTFSNMSTTRVLHMTDGQNKNFTLDPSVDIAATYAANVSTVSGGTTIPVGSYTVTLSYQDASSSAAATAANTSVVIRLTTPTPTLSSPSTSSSGSSLSINYSLPQPASPGSVTMTFTSSGASRVLQMVNTQNVSFTINPTLDLAATYSTYINGVTGGSTLPDGTYAVVLSYQEAIGNPAATATSTSVVVDTTTSTPTLTKPATNYTGSSLPINYSIPETALTGSKKIQLTNADRTVVLTLKDDASTDFSLDPTADPGANSNILTSTVTSIPDGTYDVSFSYQDSYGNTASTATNTDVIIAQTAAEDADSVPSAGAGGCALQASLSFSIEIIFGLIGALVTSLWWLRKSYNLPRV